jgi:hypothetical protein
MGRRSVSSRRLVLACTERSDQATNQYTQVPNNQEYAAGSRS